MGVVGKYSKNNTHKNYTCSLTITFTQHHFIAPVYGTQIFFYDTLGTNVAHRDCSSLIDCSYESLHKQTPKRQTNTGLYETRVIRENVRSAH